MTADATVFEKTYQHYLQQLKEVSFESVAPILGAKIEDYRLKIPLLNRQYEIGVEGIAGPSGRKPSHDVCVLLSQYILRCPHTPPKTCEWVTYRNFKDSGPLVHYFTNDVERSIGSYFAGRPGVLKKASEGIGGYPPALDVQYDVAVQFDALPRIPVVLLYNDADEEFAAQCSVLFESRAESYLDAECIAMIGWQLFHRLKKAIKP